jgi:hypothetical protein
MCVSIRNNLNFKYGGSIILSGAPVIEIDNRFTENRGNFLLRF